MTLIVTFAAAPGVVMVADRRLTWPNGRKADDESNKIVMFCNQMAFGYTGLAKLEGVRTDKWLARELSGLTVRSLSAACEHIRARATDVFANPALSRQFHSFVGVGFTPKTETSSVRPIIVDISNMYSGGRLLQSPRREFSWTWQVCEGSDWRIAYTGHMPTAAERAWITRRIRRMASKGVGPTPIIQSLRDFIRRVSDRLGNQLVGKSLLAVSIPKASSQYEDVGIFGPGGHGALLLSKNSVVQPTVGGSVAAFSGLLDGARPEFLSIPESGEGIVHAGPRLACPGLGNISISVKSGGQTFSRPIK